MLAVLVVTVFETAYVVFYVFFYFEVALLLPAFGFKLLALVGLPEAGLDFSILGLMVVGP